MDTNFDLILNSSFPTWYSIMLLAIIVFYIYCGWKIFEKADKPGWAVLIPIYNAYVILKIAGKSGWWLLLYLIPFVNFVIYIIVIYSLAVRFGKGVGYTIGLILLSPIFVPMLALGSAQYQEYNSESV